MSTSTSYTFSSSGPKTLYAWAKDAANNISTSSSASVAIENTPPSVTAFTVPATSASMTVSITSFTASDNVAVTGYLVNESATTPALADSGWSATPQTSYTFASTGSKTLYAWAKDAAGNISSSVSGAVTVLPQSHYVRAGAAGSGNGSDWTNAFTDIPVTLIRGDTYYVASGTYTGNYTFNTVDSGTTYVYIKKATASAHGTDTGWLSAYGTGTATFSGGSNITISTDYWDIDGVTGGGPNSWTSGHGFVFTSAAGTNVSYIILGSGVTNIKVHHIFFTQTGNVDTFTTGAVGIYNATTFNNSLFEYLYFDNFGANPFLARGGTGNIFQYNYSGHICGVYVASTGVHCEGIVIYDMSDVQFRWNFLAESPSSGGFVKNSSPTADLVRIYGNVFQNGSGVLCNTGTCTHWRVFNNTFTNIYGPVSGDGTVTGALIYNNIEYNGNGVVQWDTHDYNWYSSSTVACNMHVNTYENITKNFPGSCDALTETSNPFVNSSGSTPENLRLSSAITSWPGTNVCLLDSCTGNNEYNIDTFGNTRGSDGVWDRGAYEFFSTYTIGGTISGLTGTVVLQNNGGDNISTTTNGSFTFATATTTGSSYAVTILTQPSGQTCSVTNGSGTVASANVTNVTVSCVTNDSTPPAVTLTVPSANAFVQGSSVTLTATSTDNVAVAGVKFYYDSTHLIGSEITATSSPNTYTTTWNTTVGGIADGIHSLIAVARDTSNNYSTSSAVSVTVDNTAPTVTAFTIPATSASTTVAITTFTATDTVGVTGYILTATSTAPLAGDVGWTGSTPTTYTFSSAGAKTLYAWAKDAIGNVSTSLNAPVTIRLVV